MPRQKGAYIQAFTRKKTKKNAYMLILQLKIYFGSEINRQSIQNQRPSDINRFTNIPSTKLSSPLSIQGLHNVFRININIILPSIPMSPKWFLFYRLSNQNFVCISRLSDTYVLHTRMPPLAHPLLCDRCNITSQKLQTTEYETCVPKFDHRATGPKKSSIQCRPTQK